ncbi:unnamed protein product [Peronospora belbahrii]|uniref:Uncharacterized protein n=1 Tax=Peronospora belbahrii TaxID=622444 RepID=A0AAU9L2S6_9STRA|nr:unnamed protein product [Peronospora belbahrii]
MDEAMRHDIFGDDDSDVASTGGGAESPSGHGFPRSSRSPNEKRRSRSLSSPPRETTPLRQAPPLPSREDTDEEVSNPLDAAQRRQLDDEAQAAALARPKQTFSRRDYGFVPRDPNKEARRAALQFLRPYIIGSHARKACENADSVALRERLLTPQEFTMKSYQERLSRQSRGVHVHPLNGIPVVLAPGDTSAQDVSPAHLLGRTSM